MILFVLDEIRLITVFYIFVIRLYKLKTYQLN